MTTEDTTHVLNRRTVLKSIGVASAVGMIGTSAFTGVGAASNESTDPDDFRFYAITPSSNVFGDLDDPDVEQYLIEIDPSDASTEIVTEINFPGPLQTPSLSFAPDGTLYGIDINPGADGQVYTIDPSTGDVTLIGSTHETLRRMFGTTFTSDGVFHGVNTEFDQFFSPIDYTTPTDPPTVVGGLVDQSGNDIDAIHTGLTTNTVSDTIYSTLGNNEGGARDKVGIIDRDTGQVTIVATDIFKTDVLVGAEFNPCTGEFFVVRNGDQLLSLDLVSGEQSLVGTLTVDGLEVVTDNLAAMWVDCAAGCTRTIGYYKTHGCDPKGNNENEVQPLLDPDGIWLGQEDPDPENEGQPLGDSILVSESCADDEPVDGRSAEEILDTSGKKEPVDMLLAQLLAAKLNARNGADVSEILEVVLTVDRWLAGEIDADAATVEDWKDELDAYNNGYIGPGHCDDEEDDEEDGDEE